MARSHVWMALGMALCASGLVAMPTKSELKAAGPIVQELMGPELKLLKSGEKKQDDVATAALGLAKRAEGEAAKLLLYRGALDLFARAGEAKQTVETLKTIRDEIADVPLEDLSSYADGALRVCPKASNEPLRLICTELRSRLRIDADMRAARKALKRAPSDAALQRKLAELTAARGEWNEALPLFAKLGGKDAKAVENETEQIDLPAAADFWYDYAPTVKLAEPALRRHAAELYTLCLDGKLLRGLLQARAERRVEEIGKLPVSCLFSPVKSGLYLVIDLAGGPTAAQYSVSYLKDAPQGGWTDEFKTTKLVLRRLEPGTFEMGEKGKTVKTTLTQPYYIGVFEVTQKQWELVTGTNPSWTQGAMRPVEKVSWNMIRGDSSIHDWPTKTTVADDSFVGRLRARTGLAVDLPTEAQWEYACRAGTTNQYNNSGDSEDDLSKLGRYLMNQAGSSGKESDEEVRRHRPDKAGGFASYHTTVGTYLPNAWGLYDMHGNVWEWCLDWLGDLSGGADPKSSTSGTRRVMRGGSWRDPACNCVSFFRNRSLPAYEYRSIGFRLALPLSK